MLHILIPMGGPARFDSEEFTYPKPLIEIDGRPLIEQVVRCFDRIGQDKQYIFVVSSSDCQQYHLDSVLELVTEHRCIVIQLKKPTQGAACSALMAIEHIDNDEPLIISNSDHIIDYDLNLVLDRFQRRGVDAGTICFESVHPKWSFVRLDEEDKIVETAEKHPLSRDAIAGFYYFRKGSDFVRSAMAMIKKDASVNGSYFIAPVINELVLESKNLEIFRIPSASYHNFYSPHTIKEYEAHLKSGR